MHNLEVDVLINVLFPFFEPISFGRVHVGICNVFCTHLELLMRYRTVIQHPVNVT